MQFYQPAQNRTTANVPLTPPEGQTQPASAAPAAPATAPAWQNQLSSYNSLTNNSPGFASAQDFQYASRQAATNALMGAQSVANQGDVGLMDKMRGIYSQQADDLPGNTAAGNAGFDSRAQYGLKNLLSQYRGANAGRGTLGSRQYAGAQGDIVSRSNNDYINGMIQAKSAAIGQANQIQQGAAGVQNQDLNERTFQQKQAQSVGDLITKYMQMDNGREQQLNERARQGGPSFWENQAMMAQSDGRQIAGSMLGAKINSKPSDSGKKGGGAQEDSGSTEDSNGNSFGGWQGKSVGSGMY